MFQWIHEPENEFRERTGVVLGRHRDVDQLLRTRACIQAGQQLAKMPTDAYWMKVEYSLTDKGFLIVTRLLLSLESSTGPWVDLYQQYGHLIGTNADNAYVYLEFNSPALCALEEFIYRLESDRFCQELINSHLATPDQDALATQGKFLLGHGE